jgi:hypothetical protein
MFASPIHPGVYSVTVPPGQVHSVQFAGTATWTSIFNNSPSGHFNVHLNGDPSLAFGVNAAEGFEFPPGGVHLNSISIANTMSGAPTAEALILTGEVY